MFFSIFRFILLFIVDNAYQFSWWIGQESNSIVSYRLKDNGASNGNRKQYNEWTQHCIIIIIVSRICVVRAIHVSGHLTNFLKLISLTLCARVRVCVAAIILYISDLFDGNDKIESTTIYHLTFGSRRENAQENLPLSILAFIIELIFQ